MKCVNETKLLSCENWTICKNWPERIFLKPLIAKLNLCEIYHHRMLSEDKILLWSPFINLYGTQSFRNHEGEELDLIGISSNVNPIFF